MPGQCPSILKRLHAIMALDLLQLAMSHDEVFAHRREFGVGFGAAGVWAVVREVGGCGGAGAVGVA